MPEGDKYVEDEYSEETVYDEAGREDLVEDGELSPQEEAFMKGYDEADNEEDEDSDKKEDDETTDL